MDKKRYTMDDLCAATGFNRRTVRYYVQEGVIDPPAGRGRGGFYFDSQLERLRRIKALQEKGMTLAAIRAYLDGNPVAEAPRAAEWHRYEVAEGIELHVRAEAARHWGRKIGRILKTARLVIKEGASDE